MSTHAAGIREERSGIRTDAHSRRGHGRTPAGPTAQGELWTIANGRPQVRQLREYQHVAGQSPRVRQLVRLGKVLNHRREAGAAEAGAGAAPVQRTVTIKGKEIDDVAGFLGNAWNAALGEVAGWLLALDQPLDFSGPEDLLQFLDRAAAMVKLTRSIFNSGILSRKRLHESKIDYVGSEDAGKEGKLAVNVLDRRGGERTAADVASESMTAKDRGSISVALERENDWLKKSPPWTKPEHVQLTAEEIEQIAKDVGGEESLVQALTSHRRQNKAFELNEAMLNGPFSPEMTRRAQDTLMAIVPHPEKLANLDPRDGSYETHVPGGEIAPGAGGFTTLLVPQWFQPFYPLLKDLQPQGLDVRFVGNRKVTAHYKSPLGHIPVTVDAPDYESEVAADLDKFEFLVTHVLTA